MYLHKTYMVNRYLLVGSYLKILAGVVKRFQFILPTYDLFYFIILSMILTYLLVFLPKYKIVLSLSLCSNGTFMYY